MQTNSDTPTPRDHDRRLCPPWFARVGVLAVLLLVGAAFATPPAVAAAPAAGDWPQFGRTAQHPNTNPAETAFTPSNVAGLAVAWTGQFGEADETEAGPVVAGGSVYVTGFDGNLSVFDAAGCGKATCKPLRAYDVGDAGSTTTPALVGDTLLSSTQATPDPNTSGVVAAFPANGCGRPICQPRGLTQLGPDQSYQGRRSRWPAAR